jgi:hypothetical protein
MIQAGFPMRHTVDIYIRFVRYAEPLCFSSGGSRMKRVGLLPRRLQN